MKKKSKRYREILKNSIKDKKVSSKEAIDLVKKNSTTKFDESIDVSLKINLMLNLLGVRDFMHIMMEYSILKIIKMKKKGVGMSIQICLLMC